MASRMFSKDGYLPVPTMSRDLNSLPPSQSDVSYMACPLSDPPTLTLSPLRGEGRVRGGSYPPPMGLTISTLSPSLRRVSAYWVLGVISRLSATAVYSRLTLSCARRASTLSPSDSSMGSPFTSTRIKKPHLVGCGRETGLRPVRRFPLAGITQCRFEGSRAAPGSQETSPSDDSRIIPQRQAVQRGQPGR